MRLTLRPPGGSETYWKITQGRKWVGRVWCHATVGTWHGRIGGHTAIGSTPEEAFENVGALALGYASADALRQHNATVRHAKRRNMQRAADIAHRYARATSYEERDRVLDEIFGSKR